MEWSRRRFLVAGGASAASIALGGCSDVDDLAAYEAAATNLRAPLPVQPALTDFVRFATLAPNSHNTQPWTFALEGEAIVIRPDFARACPVVDSDHHHIFVSLGCAAENLLIAAQASGRPAKVIVTSAGQQTAIRVELGRATQARDGALSDAIPKRQSTRADYDGQPLAASELRLLAAAARSDAVETLLLTDRAKIAMVRDHVIAGNSAQIDNPAFVQELKDWIRFNPEAALASRDGLFTACSQNPTSPTWLGRFMFDRLFSKADENDKYARQIASSAGIAVFAASADNEASWIAAGRAFQRFALQATALGIRHAHLNMPVEVATIRPDFAQALGLAGKRPNLVIRFGRGPTLPMSLRRPVSEVLA